MSIVTGIMLITGNLEEDAIAEVQEWLLAHCRGDQLKELADGAGGGKHPQFEAWSAGINMFDEDEFATFVCSRDWYMPQNVVLVLQPENGETRVFRP